MLIQKELNRWPSRVVQEMAHVAVPDVAFLGNSVWAASYPQIANSDEPVRFGNKRVYTMATEKASYPARYVAQNMASLYFVRQDKVYFS